MDEQELITNEMEAAVNEVQPVKEEAAVDKVISFVKKLRGQKWFKPAVIAAIVLVAIIALASVYSAFFSVEGVAINAAKAYSMRDMKAYASSLAFDYKEYLLASYDGDEEEFFEKISDNVDEEIDSWNDYFKIMKERAKEDLEDEYGKFTISAKSTRVKDISVKLLEEKLSYFLENLEEITDFDRDKIDEVKEVAVKLAIKGEDDTERDTAYVCMVRIGLSWKVLQINSSSLKD